MSVMAAIGNGVLLGFLLAFMIGPVFFALIQTSIEKGFASGASMAVGIAFSDMLYVLVASLGVAVLANDPSFQAWLGLAGGIIMLVFGIINYLKKIKSELAYGTVPPSNNWLRQIGKGFLLNGINPFVLILWFGVGVAVVNFNYSFPQKMAYYGAAIVTVLSTDLLKAYTSKRLSRWLTPKFMNRMNKLVGVALIAFSVKFFYFAYKAFTV
jgi:threonine/homoserine/homoserine lactone efflux protein